MEGVTYTMFTLDDKKIGGNDDQTVPDEYAGLPACLFPGSWLRCGHQMTKDADGNVCMEPIDMPGVGLFCTLVDPQGAALALLSK